MGLMEVYKLAVLFYDHFLTFSIEVVHIWTKPLSIASLLFLINRYSPLFRGVANIVVLFTNSVASGQVKLIYLW